MASMRGFVPMIFIIRFMLYANTCKLISVLTRSSVLVRKWVEPIQAFKVPIDTGIHFRQPSLHLGACEVAIAAVHSFELAAINGHEGIGEQVELTT